MQWSMLSESTIIHQALQIVPVLSWRGSRCAQIMSLTPSVWGVNRGGEVRHVLSASKRKRFIVTSSITSTKRHNHFIYSTQLSSFCPFCLSVFHFISCHPLFFLLPELFVFFLFFFLSFILFCLPPFSIILSLFLFLTCISSYLYGLIYHLSVFPFFPLSCFPSRHVWLPFWFSEQHYTDCSVTDTLAPPLRSPFLTLVCIYSSCMKNITLHGS